MYKFIGIIKLLGDTDKGKATITDGKEVISHLSDGYYHDEYNKEEYLRLNKWSDKDKLCNLIIEKYKP